MENQPLPPDPVIEAYKQHVDRTLLRENLKLTVEQRIRKLIELQRFAEELRLAGREVKQHATHRADRDPAHGPGEDVGRSCRSTPDNS